MVILFFPATIHIVKGELSVVWWVRTSVIEHRGKRKSKNCSVLFLVMSKGGPDVWAARRFLQGFLFGLFCRLFQSKEGSLMQHVLVKQWNSSFMCHPFCSTVRSSHIVWISSHICFLTFCKQQEVGESWPLFVCPFVAFSAWVSGQSMQADLRPVGD